MNLLRDLPPASVGEIVERLAGGEASRIERIVSHGQASAAGCWYDRGEAEFVVVLAGAARLAFAGGGLKPARAPICGPNRFEGSLGDIFELPAG